MNPLSPHDLIAVLGPWAVFAVLFLETGLLVGFFLPGDSLLVTAGVLTATSPSALHLSLPLVLLLAPAGATLGAQTGFVLGRWLGPHVVDRPRELPRWYDAGERASWFLDEFGARKAVVLARFVPVVRSLINPLAGALDVPTGRFVRWQIVGGVGWTVGLVLAGRWFGTAIPSIDRYLLPVVALVIAGSLAPVLVETRRVTRWWRTP
jgi:membrane-associated protein